MADYYSQFSFIIPLTPQQTDELLNDLNNKETLKHIFEDPEYVNLGIAKDNDGLWVASEIDGNINDAVALLEHAVRRYQLPPIGFEWGNTCSKPRLDGFGGGAVWTDGETTEFTSTGEWLNSHESQKC